MDRKAKKDLDERNFEHTRKGGKIYTGLSGK